MVKKIKKNSSYSYADRNVAPAKSKEILEVQDPLLDVDAKDASFGKRLLAYVIDVVIYLPISLVFQNISTTMRNNGQSNQALYMTLFVIMYAFFLYGYLPNRWQGQTIGKKLVNLRIVPTDGKKIDFSTYLIRDFLLKVAVGLIFVPVVAIVYVVQKYFMKTQNPPLLHDRVMRTRVVEATKVQKEKEEK